MHPLPPRERLLWPDEPAPVTVVPGPSPTPFVLVCDHAGHRLPRALGDLGLAPHERLRHIAWDIGVGGVGRALAARLGATLLLQNYSRLVIDCNRAPGSPTSIVTRSERTEVPGNLGLSDDDAARRAREVFHPYHDAIAGTLDERASAGAPTALVLLHSFTPVFLDQARPWHAGVLYHRDARLAHALLELLRAEPGLVVGDNEPYAGSDTTDYTLTTHGERRGLPYVEIEIRQDLIEAEAGQREWAERLARLLPQAARHLVPAAFDTPHRAPA